jgi:hypothetical protein
MTKSALVKIGVPAEQAEGMRRVRSIRSILDQHDAAAARLWAATQERLRELVAGEERPAEDKPEEKASDEPVAAPAS